MQPDLRVAIVHDWLNQIGGAENVLEELMQIFPQAHVFTSIYAAEKMPPSYAQWPIHTSFMQKLPGIANHHQPYMPVYPLAFRQFDLSEYDLILSNKSGFCHGVRSSKQRVDKADQKHNVTTDGGNVHPTPIHICYCLTPTRFIWSFEHYQSREKINPIANLLLKPMLPSLRRWDRNAAQRVHAFVAISSEIQKRIKQIYGRESKIIHPPVDTVYFTPPQSSGQQSISIRPTADSGGDVSNEKPISQKSQSEILPFSYFLIVSRLIPYKRIDLAVQAFAQLPHERLIIVGDGRDRTSLESMATENITFLGRMPRESIRELMQYCKAFIFPGLEDFGIAPVEAMSTGRPVIAFAGGGALDTVIPEVSGVLFEQQDVESLLAALVEFDVEQFSPEGCRTHAEQFSTENFRSQLLQYIESVLD